MKKYFKRKLNRLHAGQAGQALVLMLIFLLLGSLTLVPTLMHMATALKTGVKYEYKSNEIFTADAGIETGLWRIKYDFMGPDYDPYDYTTVWPYETDPVNHLTADVTVQNVWFPNITLSDVGLDAEEAKAMIESGKLVVSGTSGVVPGQPFHIKMELIPETGDNLTIKSIGVWLPQGFEYDGNCELQPIGPPPEYYPDDVEITEVPGGSTVIWEYNPPYPHFIDFPNFAEEDGKMTVSFSFDYNNTGDDLEKMPLAVTWVVTDMDPICFNDNDVPLVWDTDIRYYKITSSTGDTDIETYSTKSQLRNLESAIAGDCVAIGNSLMINPSSNVYTTLLSSSDYTLDTLPADGDVLYAYLYWSGFRYYSSVWSDSCGDFSKWTRNTTEGSQTRVPVSDNVNSGTWTTEPCWEKIDETSSADGDYITGTQDSGGYMLFNFTPFEIPDNSILSLTIIIRARDNTSGIGNYGNIRPSIIVGGTRYDTIYSGENSQNNWNNHVFTLSTNPQTSASWTAADLNGTGANPLQAFGVYCSDLNPDIDISMVYAQIDYNHYWTIVSGQFSGQGVDNDEVNDRLLTMTNPFDLSSYTPGTIAVGWTQSDSGTLEADDTLYYAFSSDNGTTWSEDFIAFSDDISSQAKFALVPQGYYTNGFKVRFYNNFDDQNEYSRLDNITIYYMPPDTSVTFMIDDEQVYLDGDGNPQSGAQPLTTSSGSIIINEAWGGYSYACHRDVTRLVKTYPVSEGEEHHTGNAKYTVGDVAANTGEHVSYAGWSLIIIYASPNTAGHYLYLYDVFSFNPQYTNLDFDYDGDSGGDITGFVFPQPIRDKYGNIIETIAAKLTVFVGEGDAWLYGTVPNTDCIVATGQQSGASTYLSNTASPSNNVWNSASCPYTTMVGIDIDTFEIPWSANILTPNDTRLTLDLRSGQDAWNLIYFILSVRSETVTGGTGHYSINSD